MKYKRILCWVRLNEKKELQQTISSEILYFAKNYADLKNNIQTNDYVIISMSKTKFNLKQIKELITLFPKQIIHFYNVKENDLIYASQVEIMNNPAVIKGQYNAEELYKNYQGIILDLWEMRMNNSINVFYE